MRGLTIHLSVRLRQVLRSPGAILSLTLTGFATLLLWPAPVSLPELDQQLVLVVPLVMWLWLLPVAACHAVAGRAAGGRQTFGFAVGANPTLPVGPASRATAEALLVAVSLVAVRVAVFPALSGTLVMDFPGVGSPDTFMAYLVSTLSGLVIVVPFLLAWLSPSRSLNEYWTRPSVLAVVYLPFVAFGADREPVGWTVMAVVLWVLAAVLFNRPMPQLALDRLGVWGAVRMVRPACDPRVQLRRDQWGRPLRVVAPLLFVGFAAAALGGAGTLPEEPLAMLTGGTVGVFFALVGLRPLGSNVVLASLSGKDGYRTGDFVTAWSMLPVPRTAVVRGVFAHAFVFGVGSTLLLLLMRVVWVWFAPGELTVQGLVGGGFFKLLLTPLILAIPLGSFLTCAAVGRTVLAYLSLIAVLLLFIGWFVLAETTTFPVALAAVGAVVVLAFVPGAVCLFERDHGMGGAS